MWSTVRGVVPTVDQTGIDEGYLDLGEVAGDFLEARVVAEAVRTSVRGATSLTCSLGVAPCKVVAKVGSDARKPGGLVVVVPGQEAGFRRSDAIFATTFELATPSEHESRVRARITACTDSARARASSKTGVTSPRSR